MKPFQKKAQKYRILCDILWLLVTFVLIGISVKYIVDWVFNERLGIVAEPTEQTLTAIRKYVELSLISGCMGILHIIVWRVVFYDKHSVIGYIIGFTLSVLAGPVYAGYLVWATFDGWRYGKARRAAMLAEENGSGNAQNAQNEPKEDIYYNSSPDPIQDAIDSMVGTELQNYHKYGSYNVDHATVKEVCKVKYKILYENGEILIRGHVCLKVPDNNMDYDSCDEYSKLPNAWETFQNKLTNEIGRRLRGSSVSKLSGRDWTIIYELLYEAMPMSLIQTLYGDEYIGSDPHKKRKAQAKAYCADDDIDFFGDEWERRHGEHFAEWRNRMPKKDRYQIFYNLGYKTARLFSDKK